MSEQELEQEEHRKRLREAESGLGWLASSTTGTKRQKVIGGADRLSASAVALLLI